MASSVRFAPILLRFNVFDIDIMYTVIMDGVQS